MAPWHVGHIGMGVAAPLIAQVLTDWTGTDATAFTTSVFTRTTGEKFLIAVGSADIFGGDLPPSSLVQTGITWAFVATINRGGNTLAVWSGVATSSGSSALTVNFAATQQSMTWSISRLAGTTTIVQSAVAQGNPGMLGWVDAPLVGLSGSSSVYLAGKWSDQAPPNARPGYSAIAIVVANSPYQTMAIYKAIPGVVPAGIQQPTGWGENMLVIAVELGA